MMMWAYTPPWAPPLGSTSPSLKSCYVLNKCFILSLQLFDSIQTIGDTSNAYLTAYNYRINNSTTFKSHQFLKPLQKFSNINSEYRWHTKSHIILNINKMSLLNYFLSDCFIIKLYMVGINVMTKFHFRPTCTFPNHSFYFYLK